MPETTTAAARVIANSRNSEPVSPPWNPMGVYTAARVIVIAMMGPTSSRAPTSAAWIRVLPSRTCRSTFSTTTIASSTTNPTDSTIARMVRRFRLKPKAYITAAAPTSDTGIATSGTRAVRTDPMNKNTTTPTIRIVSANVLLISCNASVMKTVASYASCMSMSFGSVVRIRAISAWSRFATSISLLPTSGQTPRYTASLSLNFVMKLASSAPSSTRATSDSRTIAPFRSATIRFLNSSVVRRSVLASRLTCTRSPLVCPTAAR